MALPQNALMTAATACPNFWQIFGKMGLDDNSPDGGSVNRRIFTGDLDGGPGWT